MALEHALVRVSESFYRTYARDAQIALLGLKDGSVLARQLLGGSHSVIAGRLAGALRACGQDAMADDVLSTMRSVGHTVRVQLHLRLRRPLPRQSPQHRQVRRVVGLEPKPTAWHGQLDLCRREYTAKRGWP
jgi:hypothetical protein